MTLELQRGASLLLTCEYRDEMGRLIDLLGYDLGLTVRTASGAVVDQLVPQPTGRPGQAIIIKPDTRGYPPGLLRLDLAVGSGGITSILETIMLSVLS